MLLVDDLAAGGTKNLRHTPRGLVTLFISFSKITLRGGYKFDKFALFDFCFGRRHIRFSEI